MLKYIFMMIAIVQKQPAQRTKQRRMKMALRINHAILHILNNDGGATVLSNNELDIDSEVCGEFITKHVKKLMSSTSAKEAVFHAGSKAYDIVQAYKNGEIFFKEASERICLHLSDIMEKHVDIPSADVLVVQFENKRENYLAILKLNYKECFMHDTGKSGTDNQLVKHRSVLPFSNGKVEEACLIPYDPMVLKVLEKPYLVDGEPTEYFSELFLECDAALSKKEAVQIIQEISDEINEKYFNRDAESLAKLKMAVIEEAEEEEGLVSIENVAARAFQENEDAKREYVTMAREAGIKTELPLGEKFSRQQFGYQRMKADNGIELKFPIDLSDDAGTIEFIKNTDGSLSILLKNLGNIEIK